MHSERFAAFSAAMSISQPDARQGQCGAAAEPTIMSSIVPPTMGPEVFDG
jgi:hypothetical protein